MNRKTDEDYQTGGSGSSGADFSLLFCRVPTWIVWIVFILIGLQFLKFFGVYHSTSHWIDTHQGTFYSVILLYVFRKRVFRLCKRCF